MAENTSPRRPSIAATISLWVWRTENASASRLVIPTIGTREHLRQGLRGLDPHAEPGEQAGPDPDRDPADLG